MSPTTQAPAQGGLCKLDLPASATRVDGGSCSPGPAKGRRMRHSWEEVLPFHPTAGAAQIPFIFLNWYQQLLSSSHKTNTVVFLFYY